MVAVQLKVVLDARDVALAMAEYAMRKVGASAEMRNRTTSVVYSRVDGGEPAPVSVSHVELTVQATPD